MTYAEYALDLAPTYKTNVAGGGGGGKPGHRAETPTSGRGPPAHEGKKGIGKDKQGKTQRGR